MKCQRCGQNEATTAYVQIVEDSKETVNLCGSCLQNAEKGAAGASEAAPEPEPLEAAGDAPAACAECGMSYAEFRKEARFGCSACYAAFAPKLERLFRRIHGADGDTGKGSGKAGDKAGGKGDGAPPAGDLGLEQLKESLQVAVAAEEYEEAAELRDRIRRLEGQG